MRSPTAPHAEHLLQQLQDMLDPVAVFLPGVTQQSLKNPEIAEAYDNIQQEMLSVRTQIMDAVHHEQHQHLLTEEGESLLFDALLLVKHLSAIMRLHMIKITSGRMQDLDYTRIRNAKYKEENIPNTPFVQQQLRLMQCKMKDMNTHHIDKRSQYGISLPSLLMTLHKSIHTILHMVTDNPKQELELQPLLVPKKDRELHSQRRRREQTQNTVGNHEQIAKEFFQSNAEYVEQLEQFPEKLDELYETYSNRSDRGHNEHFHTLRKLQNKQIQYRNQISTLMLDGLLESLPGYMDTAIIINTLDIKDQFLAHLAAVLHDWKVYEQRLALSHAMYAGTKVPKHAKTTQATAYMQEQWLSHESQIKRRTKQYMLSLLHTPDPHLEEPEKQLTDLMHVLSELHGTLPKFIAFRASDPVLGKVRGFSPEHSERIRKALSHIQKVLDLHDQTPFDQIFHDTLSQPLILLEEHILTLEREALLQSPRKNRGT